MKDHSEVIFRQAIYLVTTATARATKDNHASSIARSSTKTPNVPIQLTIARSTTASVDPRNSHDVHEAAGACEGDH